MSKCERPKCNRKALGAEAAEGLPGIANLCAEHAVFELIGPEEAVGSRLQEETSYLNEPFQLEHAGAGENLVKTRSKVGDARVFRPGAITTLPEPRAAVNVLRSMRYLRAVQKNYRSHLLDQIDLDIIGMAEHLGLNRRGQPRTKAIAKALGHSSKTVSNRIKRMLELTSKVRKERPRLRWLPLGVQQEQWSITVAWMMSRNLAFEAERTGRPLRELIDEHNRAWREGREKYRALTPEQAVEYLLYRAQRKDFSHKITVGTTARIERLVNEEGELTGDLVLSGALPRLEPWMKKAFENAEFAKVDTDPPRCRGCGRRVPDNKEGRPIEWCQGSQVCRLRWLRRRKGRQP